MDLKKLIEKVKELQKTIKRIDSQDSVNPENSFSYNAELRGIKQTVEAVDKYMELANPPEDYVIWQEIKNLLKL